MNLFLFPSNSLSCVIVVLVFMVTSSVLSVDELNRLCSLPFRCADQANLFYPFWIPGREDCGHPDFELNCSGKFAEISIASVNFRILKVDHESDTLTLARADYISDLCPSNLVNATFNEVIFRFTPDTELLTLYYECPNFSSNIPSDPTVGEFSCDDYEGKGYYVTRNLSSPRLVGMGAILNDVMDSCKRNSKIPASESALVTVETSLSSDNLEKALDRGFGLRWYTNNSECVRCVQSRGACGYNQSLGGFVCYCADEPRKLTCVSSPGINLVPRILIGAIGSVIVLVILTLIVLFEFRGTTFLKGKRKATYDLSNQNLEAFIPLKRYSYAEVKKITESFTHIVGRGGFGTAYRGKLPDGCNVAVKVLKESQSNGEEFINEIASMSKTSHINTVSLIGFCYEGSKQSIIYEFVENGSLDQFISNESPLSMDWRTLCEIALGVARGLEYLHYGCKTRIVHFDIKPQNILLDDNLCPKVSNFGLAKLCEKKESIMSLLDARGTFGYIAPKVFSRNYGRVSHKSDVYSYGMLVLEMIGARNYERTGNSASNSSSTYFPDWIYKDLERGENARLLGDAVTEEGDIKRKMVLVGLWCIQTNPSDRPSMSKVIEMMEGSTEAIHIPPKPLLFCPTRSLPESVEESSTSPETSQRHLVLPLS